MDPVNELPLVVVHLHLFIDVATTPPSMFANLRVTGDASLGMRMFVVTGFPLHP